MAQQTQDDWFIDNSPYVEEEYKPVSRSVSDLLTADGLFAAKIASEISFGKAKSSENMVITLTLNVTDPDNAGRVLLVVQPVTGEQGGTGKNAGKPNIMRLWGWVHSALTAKMTDAKAVEMVRQIQKEAKISKKLVHDLLAGATVYFEARAEWFHPQNDQVTKVWTSKAMWPVTRQRYEDAVKAGTSRKALPPEALLKAPADGASNGADAEPAQAPASTPADQDDVLKRIGLPIN